MLPLKNQTKFCNSFTLVVAVVKNYLFTVLTRSFNDLAMFLLVLPTLLTELEQLEVEIGVAKSFNNT